MAIFPGAGFADLNEDLVDASSRLRYALPAAREFADAMQRLGVSDDSRVVLYDDNRAMWAARVWWMLRWIGFDNAALLDGGLQAWKAEEPAGYHGVRRSGRRHVDGARASSDHRR